MRENSTAYQLLAVLIPLGIRLIPEAISYPYPIGFDTIAYYIPIILSRLALRASVLDYLEGTILPYLPLTGAYLLLGDAISAMKIVPAVLLGMLGWSAYLVGRRSLNWTIPKALLLSVLLSLYFVTLRISWDLQRNVIGLVFVLLTLAYIEDQRPYVRFGVLPVLSSLAVMSHESSAILVLIVVGAYLFSNRRFYDLRSWSSFVPAVLLIILQVFSRHDLASQIRGGPPAQSLFASLAYNFWFLLFGFGFLIPVALMGLKRGVKPHWVIWIIVCLIFGLLPNLGIPSGAPHRWTMLLVTPMMMLFIEGADVVNSIKAAWPRRLGKIVVAGSLLVIIVTSSGYLGLHDAHRNYLRLAPQYSAIFPGSMVESTVLLENMPSIIAIAHWANETLPNTALLILPFQLYGWYVTIASQNQGLDYRPHGHERNLDDTISAIRPRTGPNLLYANTVDLNNPKDKFALVKMAAEAASGGTRDVYVVWWEDDSLDGPSDNLPIQFVVAFAPGPLAVYWLVNI